MTAITRPDPEVVRLNKLRAAIAAGEFDGDEEALKRINALANPPAPEADAARKPEDADEKKDIETEIEDLGGAGR